MPNFTVEHQENFKSEYADAYIAEWAEISAAITTGDALEKVQLTDRTVQMTGTWDGATIVMQGSLDGVTYFTLTDPQGNALSFTADGLESVMEATRFIRPFRSVAGGGTVDVKVILLYKE